jgi:hypothetical protein
LFQASITTPIPAANITSVGFSISILFISTTVFFMKLLQQYYSRNNIFGFKIPFIYKCKYIFKRNKEQGGIYSLEGGIAPFYCLFKTKLA